MTADVRYVAGDLTAFLASVLRHFAMPDDDAAAAAAVVVDADLAGVRTHGIANFVSHRHYLPGLRSGFVAGHDAHTVLRDAPVATAWDSGATFGPLLAHRAITVAMEKARVTGIGMVTVRDGRHFGANGTFAEIAARAGYVAMVGANTPAAAFAPGGTTQVVGTSPFGFASPMAGGDPLVVDIAMTASSGQRVLNAAARGESVPPGWVVDADGRSTTDPQAWRAGGALELLGGEVAGHKGFALAVMVDVLGMLSGQPAGMFRPPGADFSQGQWFAVWRPDLFDDDGAFAARVGAFAEAVRSSPGRPGHQVRFPGDGRAAHRRACAESGVPVAAPVAEALQELAAELSLRAPYDVGRRGSARR